MSVPQPQGWRYQTPEYWDSYLPQRDDFDDAQSYIDALAASAEDTSPRLGGYYNEGTGEWIGGRQTEQEYALRKYNTFMNPNSSLNAGMGGASLRLQSKVGLDPDGARLAYNAHDEFGNPLIDPAVAAYIEQALGIEAYQPPTTDPRATDPTAPPSAGSGRPGAPPVDTGFIDQGEYWENAAGHSAYLNPATGEWTYFVADGSGNYQPMTDKQYANFWQTTYGEGDPTTTPPVVPPPGAPPAGAPPRALPPVEPVGPPGVDTGSRQTQSPWYQTRDIRDDPLAPQRDPRQEMNASTIDPRYPDFILRGGMRGQNKWGPRPNGLGGY